MVNDLCPADHVWLVEMQMPTPCSRYHRDGFALIEGLFFFPNSNPIPQHALEHFVRVFYLPCVFLVSFHIQLNVALIFS